MDIHISFTAEEIFHIGNTGITNSLITGVVATGILLLGFVLLRLSLNTFNPGKFELIVEMVYEALHGLVRDILGEHHAPKFFGFLVTFFLFILTSNWLGLLPFVPSVGIAEAGETHAKATDTAVVASAEPIVTAAETEEAKFTKAKGPVCIFTGSCLVTTKGLVKEATFKPIFRAPTADLSSTFALALISVIVTNAVGFSALGFAYTKKYFNFSDPIQFFVGILELVAEIGKIVSFAFRLFGNVFAGEVLLAVITAISLGIGTLPFLGLEIFIGAIQALVFFMLTTVFISLALEHH